MRLSAIKLSSVGDKESLCLTFYTDKIGSYLIIQFNTDSSTNKDLLNPAIPFCQGTL
jgi:hypothetical protein